MKKSLIYSSKVAEGPSELIEAIVRKVRDLGLSTVVVASTNGKSALKLAEALAGVAKVVSVTEFAYSDDVKGVMKKMGVVAIERTDLPIHNRREMREALLLFGPGMKAALEVVVIAAGKGAVPMDKILAVSGSGGSFDTVLVVKPSRPSDMLSPDPTKRLSVMEIVAMPAVE